MELRRLQELEYNVLGVSPENLYQVTSSKVKRSRGTSLMVKEKVYSADVLCLMMYSSVAWPMRVEDIHHLERAEKMMIRWICGKNLRNRKTCKEIGNRLNIVSISDMVCQGRLTWSGRSERTGADEACSNTTVSVERGQDRE
jgi:hypothetical protein